MIDLTEATWRTSTRSSAQGNCVEVADNLPGVVAVRDSKDQQGPASDLHSGGVVRVPHRRRSAGHALTPGPAKPG